MLVISSVLTTITGPQTIWAAVVGPPDDRSPALSTSMCRCTTIPQDFSSTAEPHDEDSGEAVFRLG